MSVTMSRVSAKAALESHRMGKLLAAERNTMPPGEFAFPTERKLPLEDALHVRNSVGGNRPAVPDGFTG